MRWALYLQAFDYQIKHRSGTAHANVDALSRVEENIEESQENNRKLQDERAKDRPMSGSTISSIYYELADHDHQVHSLN